MGVQAVYILKIISLKSCNFELFFEPKHKLVIKPSDKLFTYRRPLNLLTCAEEEAEEIREPDRKIPKPWDF